MNAPATGRHTAIRPSGFGGRGQRARQRPRGHPRRGAAAGCLSALFLLAGAVLGGCTPSAPATPAASATPTLSEHDLAVREAQAAVDARAAELAQLPVTDAMRADATIPLDAADATIPLDAADAAFTLDPEDPTFDVEQKIDETKVRLMSDLLFEFGSAKLSAAAAARIKEYAADLPRDATVSVDGYTDSIGGASANLRLSKNRADAVAAVLRQARPDLKITARGRGEADPVAPNTKDGKDDPIARAQNRRVEVTYQA